MKKQHKKRLNTATTAKAAAIVKANAQADPANLTIILNVINKGSNPAAKRAVIEFLARY